MAQRTANSLTLGYMPWGNGTSIAPFDTLYGQSKNVLEKGIEGVDALVLWGGEDIHPSFYKQAGIKFNDKFAQDKSKRDINEWNAIKLAHAMDIPIIGVCRGAQMLCAFAGGSLIQHVTGHSRGGYHSVECLKEDGTTFRTGCISYHHQMMNPEGTDHVLLAHCDEMLSSMYLTDKGNEPMDIEPEIVYFPKIKGLAIQSHPEWMGVTTPFVTYCLQLVDNLFIKKQNVYQQAVA